MVRQGDPGLDDTRRLEGRLTIGVLLNQVEGRYQQQFWQGAVRGASRADVDAIFYLGGDPGQEPQMAGRSIAYRMRSIQGLDGMLIAGAPLHTALSDEQYTELLDSFPRLPSLVVSQDHPRIPSSTTDNAHGIRALVEHAIDTHGARSFLFIRGIESHRDGLERWDTFRGLMEEYGDQIDGWDAAQGTFLEASGYEAIHARFVSGQPAPAEMVIAANDEMAFGAIRALRELGFGVPADVAVCGFDDVYESAVFSPPLTTVSQAILDLSSEAMQRLASSIRSGGDLDSKTHPTSLVVRQSCGCVGAEVESEDAAAGPFKAPVLLGEAAAERVSEHLDRVRAHAVDAASHEVVIKHLRTDLFGASPHGYAVSVHRALTRLQAEMVRDASVGDDERSAAQGLFHRLLDITMAAVVAPYQRNFSELSERLFRLKVIMERATASTDFDDLFGTLERELPELHLKNLYLVLYPEPFTSDAPFPAQPDSAELVLELNERACARVSPPVPFSTDLILPEQTLGSLDTYELLVSPLHLGELHYGYLLVQLGDTDGIVSDEVYVQTLQALLSGALHSIQLHREKADAQEQLQSALTQVEELAITDELTGLYNRRGFFTLAGQELEISRRSGDEFDLVFADMDGLKQINDTYGHEAGDDAIRMLARAFGRVVRTMDIVARMGGDEFTAFIPRTDELVAHHVAGRVKAELRALNESSVFPFDVEVSIGVLHCGEEERQMSLEALLSASDQLLYEEKKGKSKR